MKKIFLSYRRAGGESLAYLLHEKLAQQGYTVFYDIESLGSGSFDIKIEKTIEDCDAFVLVLPPQALNNCCYENDWVRREIRCALEYGKKIIPVMMRDFVFPDNLPKDIETIKNLQGVSFETMEFVDARIQKLISYIEEDERGVEVSTKDTKSNDRFSLHKFKSAFIIIAIITAFVVIISLAFSIWQPMMNSGIDDTSNNEPSKTISVDGIQLDKTMIVMNPGGNVSLTAIIFPNNATNQSIIWKSSDKAIVSVSNGVLIAKKNGTATIFATTEDGGFVAQCIIHVSDDKIPVTNITLSQSNINLTANNNHQDGCWIEAHIVPTNATVQQVIWKTSDESVVDIALSDNNLRALIVGRSEGTAVITVTTEDGSFSATCTVTVSE